MRIQAATEQFAFETVWLRDGTVRSVDVAAPLDFLDEAEDSSGAAQAWNAAALEYEFGLKARGWFPFVPRQIGAQPAVSGQTVLRRGRTDETASAANPQYRSRIVAEARTVAEEQIPLTPLRVRRVHRYARGSDGTAHFWIGRDREITTSTPRPGLRFDYLDNWE